MTVNASKTTVVRQFAHVAVVSEWWLVERRRVGELMVEGVVKVGRVVMGLVEVEVEVEIEDSGRG